MNYNLNLPKDIDHYQFWHNLSALPFVQSIYLFGSRAREDARPKSDIDIAINCPSASFDQWQQVLEIIDEADTLLGIDIIRYDILNESLFKSKIDGNRVTVYER